MTKFLIVINILWAIVNYVVFVIGLSSTGNPTYLLNFIVGSLCWYVACELIVESEEW